MAGGKIDILIDADTRGFPGKLESGLKSSLGVAGKVGKGIALALAAGTAAAGFGLQAVIDKGVEYQGNLNELQAVTQATALDMRKVGDTAKALGADMSLPATSAADAAAAMVELAKGGLSVDDAMKAAKGTLQLAAAAQVDAAQAAEIQSNALNEFGLAADQAGHVADVLANTANAASGSIQDMANALKFVGPVAKGLGVSIDSVSTAIGLLANNGIQGEQAGTSLRGILASLASPSKQAAKAMRELGIVAFDQQGKFVGLRTITDQLAKAKGKLSQQEFAAAASTAFGNEGFTAANALANEGAKAFDEMGTAVSRAGGAADVAGAKTKGLGGAIEGFKSQVETAGIGIFEVISGPLEAGVRKAADAVAAATPAVVSGIQHLVSAGKVFGPALGDALKERASVIGDAIHDVLGPIAATIPSILNVGVNAAIGLWEDFTDVLKKGVEAAKPVARGFADVARAATESDGPLSAAGAALGLIGDGAKLAAGLLVPIGKIVGGIASAFADLPGPIQTAVIALGLFAALRGPLGSVGDTLKDRVMTPLRTLRDEIQLQQGLAEQAGQSVGRFTGALAVLESRVPTVGRMGEAFRSVSAAVEDVARSNATVIANIGNFSDEMGRLRTGLESGVVGAGKFAGAVAGVGAAAGTAAKIGIGGLINAIGGPFGVAIAAASIALSVLASRQQEAGQRAAEHRSRIQTLTDAFVESKGAITDTIRQQQLKAAQDAHLLELAGRLGVSQETMTRALLGNRDAIGEVNAAFDRFGITVQGTDGVFANSLDIFDGFAGEHGLGGLARVAVEARGKFGELSGGFFEAQEKAEQLRTNVDISGKSMEGATTTTGRFADAMRNFGDKTSTANDKARALKEALDLLSGGQVDLEAAQSRLNEKLDQLSGLFDANEVASKGFVGSLVTAEGKFNIATDNGRRFRDALSGIVEEGLAVATSTLEVTGSMDKAKDAVQATRDRVIDIGKKMGLTAEQAGTLADSMHLVPGEVVSVIKAPGMTETQVQLDILKGKLAGLPPNTPVRVDALTEDAIQKLEALGFKVTHLQNGQFEVVPQLATANAELQGFVKRWNGFVITLDARVRGGVGGNIRAQVFNESGNIIRAFAEGGVQNIKPFKAGVPQIFPPNMLRITGDRNKDDEFYIPDDENPRSYALATEWARRHQMQMIRTFALGGIAPAQGVTGTLIAQGGEFTGTLVLDSGELLGVVRGEIRHANRETRRRVLAGAGGDV